jgi:hypothetical protein
MKKYLKRVKNFNNYRKWYFDDLRRYKEMAKIKGINEEFVDFPVVTDKTLTTGFDTHYVYQGPWVFEKLLKTSPKKHVDVGSQINYMGFFSSMFPTTFVDIRPTKADFNNFTELKGSILKLPFKNKSVESLSCLHVVEHIGLGRYGDSIDPEGSKKACKELQRVIKKNGNLFFSVPIGQEKTYFNAHKVFKPQTIIDYFSELELVKFDLIDDKGRIVKDCSIIRANKNKYGCGLFWFKRA